MATVKGQVEAISRKKAGKGYAYSFKVGDNWYRHGFDEPKFKKGNVVQFDDTPGAYDVIDTSTVRYKEGPPLPNNASAGQTAGKAGKSGGGQAENWEARAKYWDEKDKRDITKDVQYNYRSAFFGAVDLIKFGVEHDMLSLGAKNASAAKKWDAFMTQVDELANDLHSRFLSIEEGQVTSNAPDDDPADEPVDDDFDDDLPDMGTGDSDDDWMD